LDPTKDLTNEEVDLTNLDVDDHKVQKDVEEMYTSDVEAGPRKSCS
jgi:hypothetical protein